MAERRGRERFVCEQPPYSILVRGIEDDVLPTCERYGMGVIPWSPLAGGWLSGRYRKDGEVPESHRARRIPQRYDMSLPGNQRKLEAADALGRARRRGGLPLIQMALAFVLDAPGGDGGDHRAAHDGAARVASSAPPTSTLDRRRPRPHRRDRPARAQPQPGRRRLENPALEPGRRRRSA